MIIINGTEYLTTELQKTKIGRKFYLENKDRQVMDKRKCFVCGESFKAKILTNQKYCSLDCRRINMINRKVELNYQRLSSRKSIDMQKSYIGLEDTVNV